MKKEFVNKAKEKLTFEEYEVIVEKGTERPFSGKYDDFFEKGTYHCKLCDVKLFDSSDKFSIGCGWPSFSFAKGVDFKEDLSHGMIRKEVVCSTCGAHLGHVFDDGPLPSGKRFCINSICLNFVSDR